MSGSRPEGLVRTPVWQNFYWALVGFCHAGYFGGWAASLPKQLPPMAGI